MQQKIIKTIWTIGTTLFFLAAPILAKDITFEISVDKNSVELGDAVELSLTFTNAQSIARPQLPDIEGFQARYIGPSTNLTIINGQSSSSMSHRFLLIPQKIGIFTIGPFRVDSNGQTYTSNSIAINVAKEPARLSSSAQQGTLAAEENTDFSERISLKMELPKNTAYVNEKLPLTIKLFARQIPLRDIQYPEITTDGISIEPFAPPRQYQANLNGQPYDIVEFRTFLFASHTGDFILGPAHLKCTLLLPEKRRQSSQNFNSLFNQDFFDNFFGTYRAAPLDLESSTIPLNAIPLPEEGRPQSFTGAIGTFSFETNVEPRSVNIGDPITLKFRIQGQGNIDTITCPALENTENFKVYEPNIKQEKNAKTFEQVLLPLSENARIIPSIKFSFFHPELKQYQTLESGPFAIEVLKPEQKESPGIEEIAKPALATLAAEERLGEDILYIKEFPGRLKKIQAHLHHSAWFWPLCAVPLAAYFIIFLIVKWSEKLKSDIRLARRHIAPKKARENLKKTKTFLDNKKTAEFYDSLFKTIRGYFGDKYHLTSAALTWDILENAIKGDDIREEIHSKIRKIFEDFDRIRYSAFAPTIEEMRQDYDDTREIIDYFETVKKLSTVSITQIFKK